MAPEDELDPYQITITGRGTTVERTVPPHLAFEVIELVFGDEVASSRRLMMRGSPQRDDLGAFLEDVAATNNAKRIAAVALFMRRQGAGPLTRETVRNTFQEYNVVPPANIPRDFAAAIDRGWIAPEPGRSDLFVLTNSGWEAVNTRFGADDGD